MELLPHLELLSGKLKTVEEKLEKRETELANAYEALDYFGYMNEEINKSLQTLREKKPNPRGAFQIILYIDPDSENAINIYVTLMEKLKRIAGNEILINSLFKKYL